MGQIVLVPFGKSTQGGMIFETEVSKSDYQIKMVLKLFNSICFDNVTIKFIQWILPLINTIYNSNVYISGNTDDYNLPIRCIKD